jgi:sulfur-carrier protein
MALTVMLSASLRRHVPGYNPMTGMRVPCAPGMLVADLLTELGLAAEEVKIIMVNGVHAAIERELAEGDRVGLFPAMGGG